MDYQHGEVFAKWEERGGGQLLFFGLNVTEYHKFDACVPKNNEIKKVNNVLLKISLELSYGSKTLTINLWSISLYAFDGCGMMGICITVFIIILQ